MNGGEQVGPLDPLGLILVAVGVVWLFVLVFRAGK